MLRPLARRFLGMLFLLLSCGRWREALEGECARASRLITFKISP